jgi:hypothetical protein
MKFAIVHSLFVDAGAKILHGNCRLKAGAMQ